MTTTPPKITQRQATADARQAGANVLHTVYVDGEPVAQRRSAHHYDYAICRWFTHQDGSRSVAVDRWSRNPKSSSGQFALHIVWVDR